MSNYKPSVIGSVVSIVLRISMSFLLMCGIGVEQLVSGLNNVLREFLKR